MRVEATALRKQLFETLRHLDEPVEIVRNGRTAAILSRPGKIRAPWITYDKRRLARICRSHKIQKLTAFGSFARAVDFTASSDVDVIVELGLRVKKTFDRHMDIVFALEDLFGRSVDIVYAADLVECDPDSRAAIERDAKVLYEA